MNDSSNIQLSEQIETQNELIQNNNDEQNQTNYNIQQIEDINNIPQDEIQNNYNNQILINNNLPYTYDNNIPQANLQDNNINQEQIDYNPSNINDNDIPEEELQYNYNNSVQTSSNFDPSQIYDNTRSQEVKQPIDSLHVQYPPPSQQNIRTIYQDLKISNPVSLNYNNNYPPQINPDSNINDNQTNIKENQTPIENKSEIKKPKSNGVEQKNNENENKCWCKRCCESCCSGCDGCDDCDGSTLCLACCDNACECLTIVLSCLSAFH